MLQKVYSYILLLISFIIFIGCSNKSVAVPYQDTSKSTLIEVNNALQLLQAIDNAKPGDSIFVHSGNYAINERIFINDSGTKEDPIYLVGDLSERPLFDYSSMEENSSNQGMVLKADHWVIKGIQFFNAGDNGLHVRGNNNVIEFCSFFENADSGLQLDDGASNNLVINCDSYFNADSKLENADGYAVKMDVGMGNKFIGCRAWNNLDDGWDGYLRETDNIVTTYENCWAFNNGYLKDGNEGKGDGNGFKTGGSDDKTKKHNAYYTRCVAVNNVNDGFDHNSNRGTVFIINCSAMGNGRNFAFSEKVGLQNLVVVNTISLEDPGSLKGEVKISTHNSWLPGFSASEEDFRSLDISQLSKPRQPDGTLPDIDFMHLVKGSSLINAGLEIGLPHEGEAPDLGAFEYDSQRN